jgi:hypothetical protein
VWSISLATAGKLTASGLGEPREAMGLPAVSRFLYGGIIANKKRKSNSMLRTETPQGSADSALRYRFACLGGFVLEEAARICGANDPITRGKK